MTLGVVVVGGKCLASPFEGEEQVLLMGREKERRGVGGQKCCSVTLPIPARTQWLTVPSTTSHPVTLPIPSGTQWLSGVHVAGMNALQAQMMQA